MTTLDPGAPGAIDSPEEFAAALTRLRELRGLSIREIARRTGTPPATLGGYFSGRHLPPLTQPQVLSELLDSLGVEDQTPWREALQRVRRVPGPRRRTEQPYRGLEPFGVDDASRFHGRERDVDALVGDVATALAGGDGPRGFALVGASGSGKSSLLRAGVVARLRADGVAVALLVPGQHPAAAMDAAMAAQPQARVVVVDQLEEVFAAAEDERTRFLAALADIAREGVVLVGLRADFYPHALAEPALVPLLSDGQRLLGPMSVSELHNAITLPALRAGGSVTPELVELLRRDLAARGAVGSTTGTAAYDAGALPLLAHALLATWSAARGGRLDVADYRATGGIDGAIRTSAEEVYAGLDDAGRSAARQLFAQLVHVDDEGRVTRRRLAHADLVAVDDDAVERVVDAFVARRILTAGEDTLDISHEALLEAWPRLREWTAEAADDLRIRRRVARAAAVWEEYVREDSQLLGGTLLTLAEGLVARDAADNARDAADHAGDAGSGVLLSAAEKSYVAASRAHVDHLARAARRRATSARRLMAVVAALVLVASGFAAWAFWAAADADEQREAAKSAGDEPLSRQIANRAEAVRATDPALAMQLALAAYQAAPTVEARSALLDATARPRVARLLPPVITSGTTVMALPSPDGRALAVIAANRVRFYARHADSAPTFRSEFVASHLIGMGGGVWRPDSEALALGAGGQVIVLDTTDLDDVTIRASVADSTAESEDGIWAVSAVGWSADGNELLTTTREQVSRWRVEDGELVRLPGMTQDFAASAVAVATGSDLVAVAGTKGSARLLRRTPSGLAPVSELRLLGPRSYFSHDLALSADGRWLAATGKDKRARVWDLSDPAHPAGPIELGGFSAPTRAIAFSRDGSRIAVGDDAGVTKVWRVGTWETEHELATTASDDGVAGVVSVDLTSDGELVVATYDGTAWVSEMGRAQVDPADPDHVRLVPAALGRPPGVDSPIVSGAVTPDDALAVASTDDGGLIFWHRDGDGWEPAGQLQSGSSSPRVVFSADGRRMVVAGQDGNVSVHDVQKGRGLPLLRWEHVARPGANGAALSPDADLLVATTLNDEAQAWSLAGEEPVELPALKGVGTYAHGVAFSPDGTLLAIGGEKRSVRLFRVDGTRITPVEVALPGPAESITELAFTADGRHLVGPSRDGALWIWRVEEDGSGSVWARLTAAERPLEGVVLDPDGERALVAGKAGTVVSWQLSVRAAADRVCATSGDTITQEEWAQHVPGAPYAPPCD